MNLVCEYLYRCLLTPHRAQLQAENRLSPRRVVSLVE